MEIDPLVCLVQCVPQTFVCLLSAFLLLGLTLPRVWIKSFFFVIPTAIYCYASWIWLHDSHLLRGILYILVVYILCVLIFRFNWERCAHLTAAFFCYFLSANAIAVILDLHILHNKFSIHSLSSPLLYLPVSLVLLTITYFHWRRLHKDLILLSFYRLPPSARSVFNLITAVTFVLVVILFLLSDDSYVFGSPLHSVLGVFSFLVLFGLLFVITVKTIEISNKLNTGVLEKQAVADTWMMMEDIRSIRHDFVNHMQVMNSLCQMGDYEHLQSYLSDSTHQAQLISESTKLDNPYISALLNSKISLADELGIRVKVTSGTSLASIQKSSVDLVRIVSNLINNALDYLQAHPELPKWIEVSFEKEDSFLKGTVANPGSISEAECRRIFTRGYTSKFNRHQGLGLYICRYLCERLGGRIDCISSSDQVIQFRFCLPIDLD